MASSTLPLHTCSWTTTDFLSKGRPGTTSHSTRGKERKQALIILNQPITRHDTLERIWEACDIKLCADGGANRLHDHLLGRSLIRQFPFNRTKNRPIPTSDPTFHDSIPNPQSNSLQDQNRSADQSTLKTDELERQSSYYIEKESVEELKWLPDLIKGDLDSLRDDVRAYYESMGVRIEQDQDEYSTDLMKCVQEVDNLQSDLPKDINGLEHSHRIIILGGLSGRLDQTIHTLSYIQKLSTGLTTTFGSSTSTSNSDQEVVERRRKERDVRVVSESSVAWVLGAGHHIIHVDHQVFGQTCGILPLGIDVAYVKTLGLKWNLDWPTSFSADISTSNHLLPEEPVVRLTTDKPIWWTMEIKDPLM